MSNYQAIATVTAALGTMLQPAASRALVGTQVTISTRRPDDQRTGQAGARVNIYLYQVTPNAAWRNVDLPVRRSEGSGVQRPQAALDLHYLLSFYGDEGRLEPQRLLASSVSTLHARSLLTREAVGRLVRNAQDDDNVYHFLAEGRSDLAEQVEIVRFTPLPLNLEELSKLWSVFFQTAYALSVAYQASVVLIEEEEDARVALPVHTYNLRALPFSRPLLEGISARDGLGQPVLANSTLVLRGQQLVGEVTSVLIAGAEVKPQSISPTEIRVGLPSLHASSIRSGVTGAQVVHKRRMEGSATLIGSGESEVAAFVWRPEVTELRLDAGHLLVQLRPQPGHGQRVSVLLNEVNPPTGRRPHACSFRARGITGDRIAFVGAERDSTVTELGLDNPSQVWGVWSKELRQPADVGQLVDLGQYASLRQFAGLTRDPALLQLTIGDEGPHDLAVPGTPKTLDDARAALEAAIQAAHRSAAFALAKVVKLGQRLLVLPGMTGATLVFAPAHDDPATITELGLENPSPVWGYWSGDLTGFAGLSREVAHFGITIGEIGPCDVALVSVLPNLNSARAKLQTSIQEADSSTAFAGTQVALVDNRLLIVPGFDIDFEIADVAAGDYLVRMQVDGAESPLTVDADQNSPTYGQYIGPKVTIP